MKKLIVFVTLFLCVFSIVASPVRTSPAPTHNIYGGVIFFKNTSSYSQYWEIDIIDNPKGGFYFNQICLEINDIIIHSHQFHVSFADDDKFDRNSADPNNYFKAIRIYDMNTGILLNEFHAGDKVFILMTGNIEGNNNNCVWEVDITDSFLTGGNG